MVRDQMSLYAGLMVTHLDWLVMLSNNIINYETEWPMDSYHSTTTY